MYTIFLMMSLFLFQFHSSLLKDQRLLPSVRTRRQQQQLNVCVLFDLVTDYIISPCTVVCVCVCVC